MLQTTRGIVLRSLKYGETSLISSIFTEQYGVQSYIMQGVRSSRAKTNKAGMLQPATLVDLVVYQKPNANLQRIKEIHPAHIYISLQEEVVKNSIALFSSELLLRLLPEHAPLPELFEFIYGYFCKLDQKPVDEVANFPVYFIISIGRLLGYDIRGTYTPATPHLNLNEGSFTSFTPSEAPYVHNEDAKALAALLEVHEMDELKNLDMNAPMRNRLLDWYIEFLQRHTQHLGNIKSLQVLRAILH